MILTIPKEDLLSATQSDQEPIQENYTDLDRGRGPTESIRRPW